MPTELTVDIISDVMCPWCYIGKRRLEKAIEMTAGEISVKTSWRPYQIDPTLPKEGKDRRQYLEDKFGGADGAERAYAAVRAAGAEEGIPFDFSAIKVSANTIDAHRLIRWARSQGDGGQDRMAETLFKAYFTQGRHIGQDETLVDLAEKGGLDPAIVAPLLASDADREAVVNEIGLARQMGVNGVPCFVIDMKYAVVGAQGAEALADAFLKIAAEKSAAHT